MDWVQFYDICRHINPWTGIIAAIFLGYRIATLYQLRNAHFKDEKLNTLFRERSKQFIVLLLILGMYLFVIILATLVSIQIGNKPTIAAPLILVLDIVLIVVCAWWPNRKKIVE